MKDLITIGLPSKGRLKEKSISFFNDSGLKINQTALPAYYWATPLEKFKDYLKI